MHLHMLQLRNVVTSMYVVYFHRNKTKTNGHQLFFLEKIQLRQENTYNSKLIFFYTNAIFGQNDAVPLRVQV
jgi:hypothetical protein